jgi:hypothetical protein
VPALLTYDYAIIRAVPRVERGEFINVGVVLWCSANRYLKARISINEAKLRALDPNVDLETIQKTAFAIPVICDGGSDAGELGKLPLSERFHWLVAPRSSSLQTSAVHAGRCTNLDTALEKIFNEMV